MLERMIIGVVRSIDVIQSLLWRVGNANILAHLAVTTLRWVELSLGSSRSLARYSRDGTPRRGGCVGFRLEGQIENFAAGCGLAAFIICAGSWHKQARGDAKCGY